MGAGKKATKMHDLMCAKVMDIGKKLGLQVKRRFKAGQTIWGTKRSIDVVYTSSTNQLGVSCISQDGTGTAYVKFFGKAADTKEYPMRGVVVYDGPGFKDKFVGVMNNYGAIPLDKFEQWARAFFNIKP